MSWIHGAVHELYSVVTKIHLPDDVGPATGFFYNYDGKTYLITNSHVIKKKSEINRNSIYEPHKGEDAVYDSLCIYVRDEGDIESDNDIKISLSDGHGTDYLLHPEDPGVDVTAIPLDFQLSPASGGNILTGSRALDDRFLPSNSPIDFEGLFAPTTVTLGYPGGLKGLLGTFR